MRQSRASVLRIVSILPAVLTAACSGGGSAGGPVPPAAPVVVSAAPLPPPNVNSATVGSNSPVLATSSMTIASMPVGTVLPLRQSVITTEVNNVKPAASS